MTPVGFEPTISAGERPQTYVIDRPATGITTVISGNKYYGYLYTFGANYMQKTIKRKITNTVFLG